MVKRLGLLSSEGLILVHGRPHGTVTHEKREEETLLPLFLSTIFSATPLVS
jgi:hypothetical protein